MLDPLELPAGLPRLIGDRAILRPPQGSDIDDRLRYPIDPEEEDGYGGAWRREWDGRRSHDRDDLIRRRHEPEPGHLQWGIEYGGECIGSARLRVDVGNRQAAFNVGIFAPHLRGIGLGQDVTRLVIDWGFVELGLHRIELEVLATNERAIRCYRACGFVHEGTRRQGELYPDGWRDLHVMGVLRDEWPM